MQAALRSTLIVGATALFAAFGAAQAADAYNGGYESLRSFLNENLNGYTRAERSGEYRDETTSVRSLVRGILKDVGVRPLSKK